MLVIHKHGLFRTGLASILASHSDIDVVAQASRDLMGIRLAEELQPDVVLIDVGMPDGGGPETTREILKRCPSTHVLVLTVTAKAHEITAGVAAGACGFLSRDTPVEGIAAAVRAAAQGAAWLSPGAAEIVFGSVRRNGCDERTTPVGAEKLSGRELEVLRLLAHGMDNAEIAEALYISTGTVKLHVSKILSKLRLLSRVQAAVYAVRQGLV